ncbi:hypothetical protein F2Q68_00045266 [Brassica cretica]|uniref:Uncharacterized protein n=1 Tax=Brassica cretica TaxID=69181 RepID=A0A8S9LQ30_BRACR|nr:hypothetical protein F2Q68_00045266 [Brassica cretica]
MFRQASRLLSRSVAAGSSKSATDRAFSTEVPYDRFDVCGVMEESRTKHGPGPDSFFLHEASLIIREFSITSSIIWCGEQLVIRDSDDDEIRRSGGAAARGIGATDRDSGHIGGGVESEDRSLRRTRQYDSRDDANEHADDSSDDEGFGGENRSFGGLVIRDSDDDEICRSGGAGARRIGATDRDSGYIGGGVESEARSFR